MKIRSIAVILVVIVSLVMASCAVNNPLNIKLNGSSWFLATLDGQPAMSEILVTAKFQNGALNGIDGCNNYGTSYTVDREKLTIDGNIAATLMACPEPIMQQATAYYAALGKTESYKIEGKRLTLLDANGKVLATFTVQETNLGGTTWIVTGYNNGQKGLVSVVTGSELTAEFSTDGSLSGSSGCNIYTATYETTGSSIKIGVNGTTKKSCINPDGVMEQERLYIQALESVASYRFNGEILEMHTSAGALAVTFQKAG